MMTSGCRILFGLSLGLLGRAVDLSLASLGGTYTVQCPDLEATSGDCLYSNKGDLLPVDKRYLEVGYQPTVRIDNEDWCPEMGDLKDGFLRRTFTSNENNNQNFTQAVYGDPFPATQSEPSYSVLVVGSAIEVEDLKGNCADVLLVDLKDMGRRQSYGVIAAVLRDEENIVAKADEILIFVSSRVMSTHCCPDVSCLQHGMIPTEVDCSKMGDYSFQIQPIPPQEAGIWGQSSKVLGLLEAPDEGEMVTASSCGQNSVLQNGQLPAEAVQLDGSYHGYFEFPGGGVSASVACGHQLTVFNENNPETKVHVIVESYEDLSHDSPRADGTFFVRIHEWACETLCPGECKGGRTGDPPPHCNLSFEMDPDGTIDPGVTQGTEHSSSDKTGDVHSSTTIPFETFASPWLQLASCGQFSCMEGNLFIPEDCGSERYPCYAEMGGDAAPCGAIFELTSEFQNSMFVQIVSHAYDIPRGSFYVQPQGFYRLCPKACAGPFGTRVNCREHECYEEEEEADFFCNCAACLGYHVGPGEHEEVCMELGAAVCENCFGDCKKLPGPAAVNSVAVNSRLEGFRELPHTSSIAYTPACAGAAFTAVAALV